MSASVSDSSLGERSSVADLSALSPGNFGIVMATGIVSLAAQLEGYPRLAYALFVVNVVGYAVLWALTLARLVRYPRRFSEDLADHRRGPGFFTVVAATSVLAAQCIALAAAFHVAMVLWVVAVV